METRAGLDRIEWDDVVARLISPGWTRLGRTVTSPALEALERSAPSRWTSLPESEGDAGVRQGGISAHCAAHEAADVVRSLADGIAAGIDKASIDTSGIDTLSIDTASIDTANIDVVNSGIPPLPAFNHAQWCRAERGRKFITPHRDPSTAGGVIAVLTLRGRATFRIWDLDGPPVGAANQPELATSWDSEDGDLVLMRGEGWPLPTSRCPIHEAESPLEGDRVTLTLRHNKGGYGSDYFA